MRRDEALFDAALPAFPANQGTLHHSIQDVEQAPRDLDVTLITALVEGD
jgi:hypothetical protein